MKPTQEQVIAWYEQANGWSPEGWDKTVQELERFAALAYEAGRTDENEACAELMPPQYFELRDRIRAIEAKLKEKNGG